MSSKICSVENCMSKARGRGMCVAHLNRERYHGRIPEANKAVCSMVGCPSYARFKALCGKHYTQAQRADVRRKMNECAVKPCPVDVYREGHCKAHYLERYPKTQTRIPDCRRPGCTQPQFRLEGCERHWKNYQRNELRKTLIPCIELGCQELAGSNGKCKSHSKPAEHCLEEGCQSKVRSMGRCQLHYNQFKSAEDFPDDFWAFVKKELNLA